MGISLLYFSLDHVSRHGLQRLQEDCTIAFSHPSGFYDDAFTLEILGGGRYDIRYTLDGSEPTAASPLYQKDSGLYIRDVSPTANRYVSRTDLSAGYNEALLEKYLGTGAVYSASEEPVDKCTVLRAAVFDGHKRIGESVCGVYFVFPEQMENYRELYTVSVVAEPDDLFGYEQGIMVTGKTQADYFASMAISDAEFRSQWYAPYWWWWPANCRNTGEDWERAVHISVFNAERQLEMDQRCGIRVQGGGSRGKVLRSLRCFARPKYAGEDNFNVDWFGEDVRPNTFILFGGADDAYNLQDYIVQSAAAELNIATMDFIPCALFINGELWGVYHITEDYGADFIADHYGVQEDGVIMVKNYAIEEGTEYQMELFSQTMSFLRSTDMTEAENYQRACELIDMESYIDYYALQTYVARHKDWPSSNFALWRTETVEASPCGDTRWRWMYFDVNSGALAGEDYNHWETDSIAYIRSRDSTFNSLFKNRDFQTQYARRLLYLCDTAFDPAECAALIDEYVDTAGALLQQTNQRIYNDPGTEKQELYMENLKLFFARRGESIRSQLAEHLDEAVAGELDIHISSQTTER